MGLNGNSENGSSFNGGFSPAFDSLPYQNYKTLDGWFQQWVDGFFGQLDIWNERFISDTARANLLDPTYTSDAIASELATAIEAPVDAVNQDTMLDVLCFMLGFQLPLDGRITTAQKQALAGLTWDILRRKGTRQRILKLASAMTGGVNYGWTVPPYSFSLLLSDAQPSPGLPAVNSERPWNFAAIRTLAATIVPAWANLGVGYTQFRAGYSGAGETVGTAGATLNLLSNEHFNKWTSGVPNGWSLTGTALNKLTSDGYLNPEFIDKDGYAPNVAQLDLTAASGNSTVIFTQICSHINNQLTHRFEIDSYYISPQDTDDLYVQVIDESNSKYWNATTQEWQTLTANNAVPWSATRSRYSFDIVPQKMTPGATNGGTSSIGINICATTDGSATSLIKYNIYRAGLYEKFDATIEAAAGGERTLWLPLIDCPGWTTAARSTGGTMLEPANAQRSAFKLVQNTTAVTFPYHAALNGRGYRSHSAWTNLVKDTSGLLTNWFPISCTGVANSSISPIVGETSATATVFTSSASGALIEQSYSADASGKTYIAGVWVKKLSSDSNYTDITLILSADTTHSQTFTVLQSEGWKLLPFKAVFSATEVSLPVFTISWGASSSTAQIAITDPYLYDVTGKTGVLYPPVVRSPAGSTASTGATTSAAVTDSQGVNTLHPLLKRGLVSAIKGAMDLTIVPAFDGTSQPDGYIIDIAQDSTHNRLSIAVQSGALVIKHIDNSSNARTVSLTLTTSATPSAGAVTWTRDTDLPIRLVWNANTLSVSCNDSNGIDNSLTGTFSAKDTSLANIYIGSDISAAHQFDGIITGVEVLQLGQPTS